MMLLIGHEKGICPIKNLLQQFLKVLVLGPSQTEVALKNYAGQTTTTNILEIRNWQVLTDAVFSHQVAPLACVN